MWLLTYLPKSQLFTKLQQKLTLDFHKSLTQHQHINVQTQGHAAENTQMKIQNYKGKGVVESAKWNVASLWRHFDPQIWWRQGGGRMVDGVHVGKNYWTPYMWGQPYHGWNCAIACSACRQCLVHLIRGDGCFCLSTCMYQTCLILYEEMLKSNLPGGSWKEDQEVGPLNNVKCLPDSHWVKGAW